MKGMFRSDHIVVDKFREIDAEELAKQPKKSITINDENWNSKLTSRSGGSFRPDNSTMGQNKSLA